MHRPGQHSHTGRARRGFTLIEVMICLTCVGLLFSAALALYVAALQGASRSSAQVSTTGRAAVTTERVLDMCRESTALSLPTDASGFKPPDSRLTNSSYLCLDGSAAAVQLTVPTTASVSVNNSQGVPCALTAYTSAATATLTIYRSDGSGNPAPDRGQYLWEMGTPPGQAALPAAGMKIAELAETPTLAAATPDAVQFVRSAGITTQQVEVRVIATDFRPGAGRMNSEGVTSTLSAKCVYLRNSH